MKLPTLLLNRLSKITCLLSFFFIMCFSIQNAQAINLSLDSLNNEENQKISLYEKTLAKLPSLVFFENTDIAHMISTLKEKYLTFYSTKHKKLNVTYSGGRYLIKYKHSFWRDPDQVHKFWQRQKKQNLGVIMQGYSCLSSDDNNESGFLAKPRWVSF